MKKPLLDHRLFVLTFLLLFPAAAHAAFEINKLGPRASAMNDAYSVLASDSWGLLYNPAQSVRLSGAQASLAYARPHIAFGNFQSNLVSGFFVREAMGTGYGLGVIFVDTNVFYREVTGLFNLGHRFGEPEDDWDFSLGTNLKVLSLRRGDPAKPYDPALLPRTLNRFTADVGTHLRYRSFFLGISAQNVLPADIGVVVRDVVPVETRVGVGAREIWSIPNVDFKVSPAVEVANRNQDTVTSGGAEVKLLDFASFICGASARNATFGFSVFLNQLRREGGNARMENGAAREETLYLLDVGYTFPFGGVDAVGSPSVGLSFLF